MSQKPDQVETESDEIEIENEQTSTENENTNPESGEESEENEAVLDEVVVTIGDEEPPPEEPTNAPDWVRELRKTNRELQRQNRELQSKLQTTGQDEKQVALGPKPKLEEYDYDADKYESALSDWFDRKRKVDEAASRQEAEAEEQQKAWKSKLDAYGQSKTALKVNDFEEAEEIAQQLFNTTQQGIMLQGADNPAIVIYALGKNPKKAKELADIKDPVKFAFAVAKLEKDLKVTNRKPMSLPEKTIAGTGRVSGSIDSTLENLRTAAAKNGDYSKVLAYKNKKRA